MAVDDLLEQLKNRNMQNTVASSAQTVVPPPVMPRSTTTVAPSTFVQPTYTQPQQTTYSQPTQPLPDDASIWQRLNAIPEFMNKYNTYNQSIGGALTILDESPSEVTGRDMEMDRLTGLLERLDSPIAGLIGQAGVGKSKLVEGFIRKANRHELDTVENRKYFVVALRIGYLKTLGDDGLQAAITALLPELANLELDARRLLNDDDVRIVLFIDEFHMMVTVFGPGTKIGGDLTKDVLARPPIRVIVATTQREFDSAIATDEPFKERIKLIEMQELSRDIVKDICRNWWNSKVVSEYGEIGDDVLDTLLDANKAFRVDSAEPRRSLDVMDDLASLALRRKRLPNVEDVEEIFKSRFSIQIKRHFDADKVFEEVERRVKGQAIALYELKRAFRRAAFQLNPNFNRALLSLLLTGPTGVGKSETTKAIAVGLTGSDKILKNFNMPDFNSAEKEPLFRKTLGETLRHRPDSVILFDEFEKCHPTVLDSMLAILDEGIVKFEVENAEGRTEIYQQSLRNSIIVATTNKASEVFQDHASYSQFKDGFEINDDTKSEYDRLKSSVLQALKNGGFKPEMISRFDRVVPFKGLTESTYVYLADKIITKQIELFKTQNDIDIRIPPRRLMSYGATSYPDANELAVYIGAVRTKSNDPSSSGARALTGNVKALFEDEVIEYLIDHPGARYYEAYVSKQSKLYDPGATITDGGIKLNAVY